MGSEALVSTSHLLPPTLPLVASGKVRDTYALPDGTLLFIATDRISAFDVSLANGIPNKGRLLTQLTEHWFALLSAEIPELRTHVLPLELPSDVSAEARAQLTGRAARIQRLKMLPLEAIVRGHISGSAWAEYQRSGTVHGAKLPKGLRESEAIPGGPIFTPSTKAVPGEKDENISQEQAAELVGADIADRVKELALSVYRTASAHAAKAGVIIADTKLEFGLDGEGNLVLGDEVLTPDSSRFWDAARFEVGRSQDSFDKQYLREWLIGQGLKGKEGVVMPEDVVARTAAKYREAYERLSGKTFE